MRERPKQSSYLERHRTVEEGQPRCSAGSEQKKSLINSSSSITNHSAPMLIPKKIDKGGSIAVLRVRAGGSSRVVDKAVTATNSALGGKMTQFKSLDDIPDGLPESPQHCNSGSFYEATSSENYYEGEYGEDENDDEDYDAGYAVPAVSQHSKQPMLPFERESNSRNSRNDAKSDEKRSSKVMASSKNLLLKKDGDTKNRSVVSTKAYPKSVQQANESDDDEEWGNDSEGDSQPPYQAKCSSNEYDDIDGRQRRHSGSRYDDPGRPPGSRTVKSAGSLKLPPELPFEARQEDWKAEEKIGVKEQLYFSKQPRQTDYTPYTLGQYRQSNPKEYVEIVPHIRPDLNTDILKAKRANADRVKDFSKQLHEFNKVSLSDQRRLPYSSEAVGVQMTKKKLESSRERANQFAKKIPKPAIVKPKGSPDGRVEEDDEMLCGFGMSAGDEKASKLEELQAKHLESKRNIEAMRRSMGM